MNSGRDRDVSVERLLRRSLAGGDSSAADACPDAETLAAWVDGGLGKRDVALVEAHASDCTRCQALLATLVQTAPDPSVPASQETWWPNWGRRWLVPLAAAAAAAVILWIAIPNGKRPDLPEQASAQLPKDSPAPPEPEVRSDRPIAPAALPEQAAVNGTKVAQAEDKAASIGALGGDLRKENAGPAGQVVAEPVDALKSATARAVPPAAAADQSQSARNETAALSRSASSVAPQGQAGAGRVPSIEITSPDPAVRWRIGGTGSVEHTTNGGTTWEAVPTGINANLTAGASPSRVVCWLVGRAGTVLLSTDGRTWRHVSFPETADLVGVQAVDAQTATVTTADGRTFRTLDGGLSWR